MQNTSQLRSGIWPFVGVALIAGVVVLVAAIIVIALIPLYIKSSTQPEGMILKLGGYSTNITIEGTNLPTTKWTMNSRDLLILQSQLQKALDSNSDSIGSKITVTEASVGPLGGKKKRELVRSQRATTKNYEFSMSGYVYAPQTRADKFQVTADVQNAVNIILKDFVTVNYLPMGLTTETPTSSTTTSSYGIPMR